MPTLEPTYTPGSPTPVPSSPPTPDPSAFPTVPPTPAPSSFPTPLPTSVGTDGPTLKPVPSPRPTPEPTDRRAPTQIPTFANFAACDAFIIDSATNEARTNTVACGIRFCAASTITMSTCPMFGGQDCVGTPVLRLMDSGGKEVAYSGAAAQKDLGCGNCAQITYTAPGVSANCQVYALLQGCAGNTTNCGGTTTISGVRLAAEIVHFAPSPVPTPRPIAPTRVPSVIPSPRPTRRPHTLPTRRPTRRGETTGPTVSFLGTDLYRLVEGGTDPIKPQPGMASTWLTGSQLSTFNSSFGRNVIFSGLSMAVGAPDFLGGDGMVQLFDCRPLMSSLTSGCVFQSTILGPASQGHFGSSLAAVYPFTSSSMMAVGLSGKGSVRIYRTSLLAAPQLDFTFSASTFDLPAGDTAGGFGRTLMMFAPQYSASTWTSTNRPVVLAVGAPTGGHGTGAVYIYLTGTAAPAWSRVQSLYPVGGPGERLFGKVLAQSSDGMLAVGSVSNPGIKVYVYRLEQGPTTSTFRTNLGFALVGALPDGTGSNLPILYAADTGQPGFTFSLALAPDTLLLGVPCAANGNGVAVTYAFDLDPTRNVITFLNTPAATYSADQEELTDGNGGPSLPLRFGQTVAITTRPSGRIEMGIGCPRCGMDDPRGSIYVYLCSGPGLCGETNSYTQKVFVDAPETMMDWRQPASIAYSQTGAIMAVGTPLSYGSNGAVVYFNAASFPFTLPPTIRPSPPPTPGTMQPTLRPSAEPTRRPTAIPTLAPTSAVPTSAMPAYMQFVVYFTLSVSTKSNTALRSSLLANDAWAQAVVDTIIQTCHNLVVPSRGDSIVLDYSLTPFSVTSFAAAVKAKAGADEAAHHRSLQGLGSPLYVAATITVLMSGVDPISGRLADNDFFNINEAFKELRGDIVDALTAGADGSATPLTKTLQTRCSPGGAGGCDGLKTVVAGTVGTDSALWVSAVTSIVTDSPSLAPTAEPTVGPTPAPNPPTWRPSPASTDLSGALATAASGSVLGSPGALGGIAAAVIVVVFIVLFVVYQQYRVKKDAGQDRYHDDGGDIYSDGIHGYEDDEQYVERPSGGVEMLENPVYRRGSGMPMSREAMDNARHQQHAGPADLPSFGGGDGGEGGFAGAPPVRASLSRPSDPYGRFGGGAGGPPVQRLSVVNPLAGMSPPGLSGASRPVSGMTTETTTQPREVAKRFSVVPGGPTPAEFTPTGVMGRLGAPRPDAAPSPGSPLPPRGALKPFQHPPLGPQGHAPVGQIKIVPSADLASKLQAGEADNSRRP